MQFSDRTAVALVEARVAIEARNELMNSELRLAEETRVAHDELQAIESRMVAGEDLVVEWRAARHRLQSTQTLLESNWATQSRVRDAINRHLSEVWGAVLADHLPPFQL